MNMDGTPDTLTYSGASSNLPGGIAVWEGSTHLTWWTGSTFTTTLIDTRFTLSVTDPSDQPLPLTDATAVSGMPVAAGAVLSVAGDFKSIWLLEARAPDTQLFEPAHDLFDRLDTQGQIAHNVGEGFYYTVIDCGDAPDPGYPTLLASNGARHELGGGLYLGACIDAEADALAGGTADGDDGGVGSSEFGTCAVAGDDEDGVEFTSSIELGIDSTSGTLNVTASALGKLDAWLDFNADGDWDDAGEQIFTNLVLSPGVNSESFTSFASAVPGPSYARFRLSSAGSLSHSGMASDGEIEDYAVTVSPPLDLVLLEPGAGGERTYWACNSISAGELFGVLSGADIVFHSGAVVALRDGFSIASEGVFTVILGSVPGCSP
jgi:hypothetical protein